MPNAKCRIKSVRGSCGSRAGAVCRGRKRRCHVLAGWGNFFILHVAFFLELLRRRGSQAGFGGDRCGRLLNDELAQLIRRRQVLQARQSKVLQKQRRRAVGHGPAYDVRPANLFN